MRGDSGCICDTDTEGKADVRPEAWGTFGNRRRGGRGRCNVRFTQEQAPAGFLTC